MDFRLSKPTPTLWGELPQRAGGGLRGGRCPRPPVLYRLISTGEIFFPKKSPRDLVVPMPFLLLIGQCSFKTNFWLITARRGDHFALAGLDVRPPMRSAISMAAIRSFAVSSTAAWRIAEIILTV